MSRNLLKNNQSSAILEAIYNDNISTVEELISNDLDINRPQYVTVYEFRESLCSKHITKYARISIIYPIVEAVKYHRNEIAKLLLNAGANPNVKNDIIGNSIFYYWKNLYYYDYCEQDLELFVLLLKNGAFIDKNKDFFSFHFHNKEHIKQLVYLMRKAKLFDVCEENKPSIAETVYNKLVFNKDYPDFESFSQAYEIPSLLFLAAKAAIHIIQKNLQKHDSTECLTKPNSEDIEPLVELINKMMPKDAECKLTHIWQIQQMIDEAEIQALGDGIDGD